MFADITYEGARSVIGPFLNDLGASATQVGIIAGIGEMLAASLRFFSGRFADRTRSYWTITICRLRRESDRGSGAGLRRKLVDGGDPGRPGTHREKHSRPGTRRPAVGGHRDRRPRLGIRPACGARSDRRGHRTADRGRHRREIARLRTSVHRTGASGRRRRRQRLLLARAWFPAQGATAPQQIEQTHFPRIFWIYVASAGVLACGFVDFALLSYHFQKTGVATPGHDPSALLRRDGRERRHRPALRPAVRPLRRGDAVDRDADLDALSAARFSGRPHGGDGRRRLLGDRHRSTGCHSCDPASRKSFR